MAEMPRGLYGLPVSFGARSLLGLLWSFAGSDTFVWPSRRRLAEMLGVDPRSLRRMLRSLEEVGALQESKERRGGYVRAGWWLVAAPVVEAGKAGKAGGGEGDGEDEGAEEGERGEERPRERGERGEGALGLEVIETDEGDADEDARDVVGVGELGEREAVVERGAAGEGADRAVRRRGLVRPGGEGVQRTRASEEEDRAVRAGGPSSPRGRTVRSSRRNQEPARTNHEPSAWDGDGRGELERARRGSDEEPDVEDELRTLARWRTEGGDPQGLGPWPEAVTPKGVTLPPLAFRRKELRARLGEGRSAIEVHRAVHGFAELVRAGVLAVENWRAPYCFAGFFDGLVVAVRQLEAKRQREIAARPRVSDDESNEATGVSMDTMAAVYAGSESLRSMVGVMQEESIPLPTKKRLGQDVATKELVSVRIRVQAIADVLGREVDEVLQALGRRSMREVVCADDGRLDRVFVALRDGASIDDVAAFWIPCPLGSGDLLEGGSPHEEAISSIHMEQNEVQPAARHEKNDVHDYR